MHCKKRLAIFPLGTGKSLTLFTVCEAGPQQLKFFYTDDHSPSYYSMTCTLYSRGCFFADSSWDRMRFPYRRNSALLTRAGTAWSASPCFSNTSSASSSGSGRSSCAAWGKDKHLFLFFIYSTEPDPDQCPMSFFCYQKRKVKFLPIFSRLSYAHGYSVG